MFMVLSHFGKNIIWYFWYSPVLDELKEVLNKLQNMHRTCNPRLTEGYRVFKTFKVFKYYRYEQESTVANNLFKEINTV